MPTKPCTACNGTGRRGFSKCVACNGTRVIEVPEPPKSPPPWGLIASISIVIILLLLGWRPLNAQFFGVTLGPPVPTETPEHTSSFFPVPTQEPEIVLPTAIPIIPTDTPLDDPQPTYIPTEIVIADEPSPIGSPSDIGPLGPVPSGISFDGDYTANIKSINYEGIVINRIMIDESKTTVWFHFKNITLKNIAIGVHPPGDKRAFFIISKDRSSKFLLTGVNDIPIEPKTITISPGDTYDFSLTFERLTTRDFHILEGEVVDVGATPWNFLNIHLNE